MVSEANVEIQLLDGEVRDAFVAHDLWAFGALLCDDVTFGDVDTSRGCRNRPRVLATFAALLDKGMDGRITELTAGTKGILCGLEVTWPARDPRSSDANLYHVYLVRNGQIDQIRRFDDRDAAAHAAGVGA